MLINVFDAQDHFHYSAGDDEEVRRTVFLRIIRMPFRDSSVLGIDERLQGLQ